ncbi:aminotransferase, partial [Tamilnaduibacter salinus]
AIGRIQLQRMPEWHRRRLANSEKIWRVARSLPGLSAPDLPQHIGHGCYKCYIYVVPGELAKGWDRDRIAGSIVERGVPCFTGSCSEVYREKAFLDAGLAPEKPLETARWLGIVSLMFLVHPTLTDDEINKTLEALSEVMECATDGE